jgi:RES domain-containing protein
VELADVVAALDGLAATGHEGAGYRHIAVGRSPLSGEGARLNGGRWNPPNSFAVLYLALDRETAIREFHRLASKQGLAASSFLPRDLYTYEVRLQHVLDLRMEAHAAALGLVEDWLADDDPSKCQLVGEAAHHIGLEALLAPSAAGQGEVLAVFLDRILPGSIVRDVEHRRWNEVPGLPN